MIEIAKENLIPLSQAPRHLPPRPSGKRLHISAIYRWIGKGVGGVRLESIRLGGTTYTSLEAIQRFAERLSRGLSAARDNRSSVSKSHERATLILRAELGLDQLAASPVHGDR